MEMHDILNLSSVRTHEGSQIRNKKRKTQTRLSHLYADSHPFKLQKKTCAFEYHARMYAHHQREMTIMETRSR